MGKVDWINWKTDAKEIISPKRVEDSIMESYQDFNTIMNPVIYEQIKHEILTGGLSAEALVVSGSSPANKAAKEIIELIEKLKQQMNTLKQTVVAAASEQKEIEKEQLIEAIEEKLSIEKIYLDNINNSDLDYDSVGTSREELREIAMDRINKLQERLDCVKAL